MYYECKKDEYGAIDITKEYGIEWILVKARLPKNPTLKYEPVSVFVMIEDGQVLKADWDGESFNRQRHDIIKKEIINNVFAWTTFNGNMFHEGFYLKEVALFMNLSNEFYKNYKSMIGDSI